MKTHLLNFSMMPQPGRYRLPRIDADEFADLTDQIQKDLTYRKRTLNFSEQRMKIKTHC